MTHGHIGVVSDLIRSAAGYFKDPLDWKPGANNEARRKDTFHRMIEWLCHQQITPTSEPRALHCVSTLRLELRRAAEPEPPYLSTLRNAVRIAITDEQASIPIEFSSNHVSDMLSIFRAGFIAPVFSASTVGAGDVGQLYCFTAPIIRHMLVRVLALGLKDSPTDFNKFVLNSVQKMRASAFTPIPLSDLNECVFSKEFYAGMADNLPGSIGVYSEFPVPHNPNNKGQIDFKIDSVLQWGVQLLWDGRDRNVSWLLCGCCVAAG